MKSIFAALARVLALPLLLAAMTSMEGVITGQMEAGDHVIFLVTLTNAVAHRDPAEFDPFVHVRKNAIVSSCQEDLSKSAARNQQDSS